MPLLRLSNRTKKYAKNLNYQKHRHPVIKAMLVVFEILSDYEDRKETDPDPKKFMYTLGFSEGDVETITRKSSRSFVGRGHFNSDNTSELCSIIEMKSKYSSILNKYDIIWVIFSSKEKSVDDIFGSIFGISKEGKDLLKKMYSSFENEIMTFHRRYFNSSNEEVMLSFINNR